MSRNRLAILAALGVAMVSTSAFGDAIRHSVEPVTSPVLIASLEESPRFPSVLTLSTDLMPPTSHWSDLVQAPLFSTEWSESALASSLQVGALMPNNLMTWGNVSEAMSPIEANPVYIAPELASNATADQMTRIPEPASFALLAAGAIVFLVGGRRLRKSHEAPQAESLESVVAL